MNQNRTQSPTNGEEKMRALCQVCGQPMPEGEEMFNYHGYSGDCPVSPLPPTTPEDMPMGISQWQNHGAKHGYDKYFDDRLKQAVASARLALLEQMIGDMGVRRKKPIGKDQYGTELYNSSKDMYFNEVIDLINTNLRTKIEELKKQI